MERYLFLLFYGLIISISFPNILENNSTRNQILTEDTKIILIQELTVGDSDDEVILGGSSAVSGLKVDEKGNIYYCDMGATKIYKFNQQGEFVQVIGRKGKGPGEYSQFPEIDLINGKLYVLDWRLLRISIFDTKSGNVLRTIPLSRLEDPTNYGAMPSYIYVTSRNKILLRYRTPYSPGTSDIKRMQKLVLFNNEGKVLVNPVIKVKEPQSFVYDNGSGIYVTALPYGRRTILHVTNDGTIFTGWTNKLSFNIYSLNGRLIERISFPYQSVELTDQDLKAKLNLSSTQNSSPILDDLKEEIPEVFPAFDWFVIDEQKRLWIAVNTKDRAHYSLRLYINNGKNGTYEYELMGSTQLPKNIEIQVVKDGKAYAIVSDPKTNVEKIVRYDIKIK